MIPLFFYARSSSNKFNLDSLYYCIKKFASVNKIKYYQMPNEDYALVEIKNWKTSHESEELITNLSLSKQAVIPLSCRKYWLLTPIDKNELMSMFVQDFQIMQNRHEVLRRDVM